MVRPASKNELLPGTLEMLILQTLTRGAMHGYGIAQHIQEMSDEVLQVEEGSLYPALQAPEPGWGRGYFQPRLSALSPMASSNAVRTQCS
jgi:hypothetical protein